MSLADHPRILNAEAGGYSPDAADVLRRVGEVRLEELDRDALVAALPWASALIVRLGHRVDRALLDAAPDLEVVVTATTGLDHVDLEAAADCGVEVLSLRGEYGFLDSVHATAEHTWAILLGLLRRIPWAHEAATRADWDRDWFRGRELTGRRLGLVGLGRIGRKVAGYGTAFSMEVGACDPTPERWVDGVVRFDDLVELARWSDVLSIHVPLDESTEGLVDQAVLHALGSDGVLVNTSRGGVVDEGALVAALSSGGLGGAALDVVVGETTGGLVESELLALARRRSDVLITPHIGGATLESMAKTEIFMAEKLRRFYESR